MRTFKLDKLVRDKIVAEHVKAGGKVDYKVLRGDKLTKAYLKKIIEEANEIQGSDLSVGELADLQELVDALATHLRIKPADLAKRQAEKRKSNGGFKKGHYINTTALPDDNKWSKYFATDPRSPEVKK